MKRYRVTYTLTAFVEAESEDAAMKSVETYQTVDYDSSDLEAEEDEDV